MSRFCFLVTVLLTLSVSLGAQEKVPDMSGCIPYPGVPEMDAWIKSTDLIRNRPYRAAASREKKLREAYAKIELAMSRSGVEKIMGKPDFQHLMAMSSAGKPTGVCIDQWVYVFRKSDTNPINPEDAAIFLSFSANGELYWVVPQNIDLKQKGNPTPK